MFATPCGSQGRQVKQLGQMWGGTPPISTEQRWAHEDEEAKEEDDDDDVAEEDDGVHLSRLDVPDSNHVPANRLVGQDCIRPTLFTVVS